MSKWGKVRDQDAKTMMLDNPEEAIRNVVEMAEFIIGLEDKIYAQATELGEIKDTIISAQMQIGGLQANMGKLEGYIERVRETDPKLLEPERRK